VAEQLARAGLPSRRDLVRYSPPEHSVLVEAATELLVLPRPPSALLTANTDVALAQACRRTGRRLGAPSCR
jgi:DNA-binding LacI/PurR family transcriptional regulator